MMKNFTAKATFPITLSLTGFVAVCCIVLYSFIKKDLVNNSLIHQVNLSESIIKTMRYSMLTSDMKTVRLSLQYIGEQDNVEYLRVTNKAGKIILSSDERELGTTMNKEAAGCVPCHRGDKPVTYLGPMEKARHIRNPRGEPVIAVTVPIYNEPDCASLGCHPSLETAKILGILDMGLSGKPLAQALGALRMRMIVFLLMVLIVTMGGSCALLRRNVLIPLRELVTFTEMLKDGKKDVQEPHGAPEIEALGKAIHEMHDHDVKGSADQSDTGKS